MKFSSFVGSAVIFTAGIGTGLYLCYKGMKLVAKIVCDEPKVDTVKHKRVVPFVAGRYDIEYDGAFFATRHGAEEALDKLQDIIDKYGYVTMADLHYLAYFKDFEADDSKGWKDLSKSEIMRIKEGYRLRLGKPIELDT